MSTTTSFTPSPRITTTTTVRVCKVCAGPSTEEQGLVLEADGYVHAACSDRNYILVTEVSIPSGQELGEYGSTPAPARFGLALCDNCTGAHESDELCQACQEAINEWESDYAPDYDVLYERYLAAKDYLTP